MSQATALPYETVTRAPTSAESRVPLLNDPIEARRTTVDRGSSSAAALAHIPTGGTGLRRGTVMCVPTSAESRARLRNDHIGAPRTTAVRGDSSAAARAHIPTGGTGLRRGNGIPVPTSAESRARLSNDPMNAPQPIAVPGTSSAAARGHIPTGETGLPRGTMTRVPTSAESRARQGCRKGVHSRDRTSATARGVRTSVPQVSEPPVPTAGDRRHLDQAGHSAVHRMSSVPHEGLIPTRERHAMAEPGMTGAREGAATSRSDSLVVLHDGHAHRRVEVA